MEKIKYKVKTFQLLPKDFEWLLKIKKIANGCSLGNISLSHVLTDIIRFARSKNYEGEWPSTDNE